MNTRSAWAVVAQREISIRLRDKTFIGSTLLSLVILVGVFGFQTWQSSKDTTFDVAVTSQSQQMGQVLHTAGTKGGHVGVDLVDVADDDAAEAALDNGKADVWLHRTDGGWQLTGKDDVDDQLEGFAEKTISQTVMADNAQQAGTSIGKLQQGATVSTASLNGDADQEAAGQVVGFIMAILFYMSAIMFGSYLAMSVTEEKQSRIVEIIATSIPLRQLLIGKLVGMVVLAVAQMMLYALIELPREAPLGVEAQRQHGVDGGEGQKRDEIAQQAGEFHHSVPLKMPCGRRISITIMMAKATAGL